METKIVRSIGEVRLEYIDTATKLLGSGNVDGTLQFIENFLSTVKNESPVAKKIQESFDKILLKKQKTLEKLLEETEKLGKWEQAETRGKGREYAEIQAINDRLNECWQLALENGLFNE